MMRSLDKKKRKIFRLQRNCCFVVFWVVDVKVARDAAYPPMQARRLISKV
jgi:hypothetical protein